MTLFKHKDKDETDETPQAPEPEPSTAIVPVTPVEADIVEVEPGDGDTGSGIEMSPVSVPPSHEEFLIEYRSQIKTYYFERGWQYTEGGEEEDKMMAVWEDFYREIFSEDCSLDEAEMAWEQARYRKEQFLGENQGMSRYIEWLQLACENKRSERGTLHKGQMKDEPVDWGISSERVERYASLRTPEQELMRTSPSLKKVVEMMLDDIENNYDVFAIIFMRSGDPHGGVGGGKSDFCVGLQYMLDETYDLRYRTVFYKDVDRMDRLQSNKTPFIAWNWDEGEWWAYKQDWMDKAVKEKTKEWMSRRSLRQKVAACFPQGRYVATNLQDRVTWSFRVMKRGVIEVYRGSGWSDEEDHYGSERVTLLEVGKISPNFRQVYDRCKEYATANGAGALDRKLAHEFGKGRQWPYEELGIPFPGDAEETAALAVEEILGEEADDEAGDGEGEDEL